MTPGDPAEAPSRVLPRGLAPLGYRNFALYWVGFAASNTGRWIELTGSVWLVYDLTQSPILLGILGIARAAPSLIVSPFAGVIADRVDQRRFLFILQVIAMLASFILGMAILSGRIEYWHIYLQVAIQATITCFDSAIRQALFPRLIPRSELPAAVTLSATAGRTSKLIGPAVGGVAIAAWGPAAPFLLNSVTFLGLMAAVVTLRGVTPLRAIAGSSVKRELMEGLRHLRGQPVLNGLMKRELLFTVFQLNPVLITIAARQVLHVGPEGLGALLAAPALGSLVGIGWLLATGHMERQGRFLVFGTLGYASLLVTFAFVPNAIAAFAVLALIGVLDSMLTVTRNSVMQLAAPSHMRGRLMANMGTVTRGFGPLAETQSGAVAGLLGSSAAVVLTAAALAVNAALTPRLNKPLWHFSRRDVVETDEQVAAVVDAEGSSDPDVPERPLKAALDAPGDA